MRLAQERRPGRRCRGSGRVVKSDPALWAATPLQIAASLHEPMYIGHYLLGLAEAETLDAVPVSDLVDLITLVFAHPWAPRALDQADLDLDLDVRS